MADNPAIVSLTFDDALDVHLDVAMPIIERHGLRGTFYLNVGSKALATGEAVAYHEIARQVLWDGRRARSPHAPRGQSSVSECT